MKPLDHREAAAGREGYRMPRPSQEMARTLLVPVLLMLLVVINAIALLTVERFSLKLDLTDARLYELSAASHQAARQTSAPIRITVFSSEQDYPAMLREILARYASLSERIAVSYKDPFTNPVLIDRFMERGTRIQQNDLVVEVGDRFKHYAIKDLYVLNSAKTKLAGIRAEQQLTGAIIQLQSTRIPGVRFIDGHDETPSKALMDLFARNNYQVERVALPVKALDERADIVVIAAPTRDFTGQEISALNNHLLRGGSLMVFLAPAETPLSRLEAFLVDWGIAYGNALVFEPKAHISDNRINIVPMYAQHEINVYFGDKRSFLLMPAARPLAANDKASYDLDVMTVLSSTPDAYARQGHDFVTQEKVAGDQQGPFALALTAVRKLSAASSTSPTPLANAKPDEAEALGQVRKAARVFAAGSASLYADDIMGMSSFANADFLTQTVKWLNPEQAVVNIPAKSVAPDPLVILPGEAAVAGVLLTVAIPLLILLAGFVVAVRRRRAR